MLEKLFFPKDKDTVSNRFLFIGLAFLWLGLLQLLMIWKLQSAESFICNGGGAWPLNDTPILGGSLLTLFVVIALFIWAWRSLTKSPLTKKTFLPALFWSFIIATGISHSIERITSACVLDYWQVSFFKDIIYFNGGDVFLFIGALGLILIQIYAFFCKN